MAWYSLSARCMVREHSACRSSQHKASLLACRRTKGVHRLMVALCWESWKGSRERFRQLRLFSR